MTNSSVGGIVQICLNAHYISLAKFASASYELVNTELDWCDSSTANADLTVRSELSLAGVTVLLTVGATLFSCYSISHPKYTYRRLAAVLHLLTAVTVLAVIQLVEGGVEELVKMEEGDTLLYGYSYLLAWATFLASLAASLVFLAASRKRKLLDSDNVNFTHHKLDISVSSQQ